jgi:DNA-binding transcriptional MerR regulator
MGAPDRSDGVLPPIPDKRYFTIGEVSELCLVKPYVLRYWEQEFLQLKPMKRRGNRRYYQHHEVLLVRRIRELLYEQGFTIHGARIQLADVTAASMGAAASQGADEAAAQVVLSAEPGWGADMPQADAGGPVNQPSLSHAQGAAPATAAGLLAKGGRRNKGGAASGVGSRALQASPSVMSAEAWVSAPDLSGLKRLAPDDVQALREALLSIRDLLA